MTDAREICEALGGRWSGDYAMVRCPCHEDRTPSLSISDGQDGKLLVHCFAGCDGADVLAALRVRGLLAGRLRDVAFRPDCCLPKHHGAGERARSEPEHVT